METVLRVGHDEHVEDNGFSYFNSFFTMSDPPEALFNHAGSNMGQCPAPSDVGNPFLSFLFPLFFGFFPVTEAKAHKLQRIWGK